MARPVHFEILADEPEKAAVFYSDVFGWKITTWDGDEQGYWLANTGPDDEAGIHGALMHRHFPQAVINTVEVESLEETLEKVSSAGGKKIHGPEEIPGVGTHAYCEDPEGNLFGVMQPDRPSE